MFFSTNSSCNTKNVHDPFGNLPHDLDHSFHPPISSFPFPSPFEVDDDHDLNFTTNSSSNSSQNYNNNPPPIISTCSSPPIDNMSMMMMNSDHKMKKMMKKVPQRKRLSKKDRHSKITTAKGVRDRRMRLSLPVAKQFFGLQDMLGVDKGSKTVEWLLIQAKPEILKLAREKKNHNCFMISNSSSNYSNSSELDNEAGVIIGDQNLNTKDNNIKINKKKIKKKKIMRAKQLPIRKTMAKELREKARERARARTLEKQKNQLFIRDSACCSYDHQPNFTNINSSSSWSSPFETTGGEESAGTTHQSYNNNNHPITSQFDSQFHQNFSSFDAILPKWSPSDDSTFNFLHQQVSFEVNLLLFFLFNLNQTVKSAKKNCILDKNEVHGYRKFYDSDQTHLTFSFFF